MKGGSPSTKGGGDQRLCRTGEPRTDAPETSSSATRMRESADAAGLNDRAPSWELPFLFALGLVISVLMIARSQVDGDALCLLARGWLLAKKGIWAPFGNPAATSCGGYVPGGLTALVVGLPLTVWMDHRAPVVLILICHVIAYLLLDRLLKETLGSRARLVFAIIYWLNPWRLYNSAWLDNSNYVFLTGAVHAWTCYRQRNRPSFLHSTLLVAAVGLTFQLHLDAMLLVIAAVLLWLRGYWKPHWGGVALGALITFGALIPFLLEVRQHPEIIPGSRGFLGSNLVKVWPVLKGILYWVRYASLWCSHRMLLLDFTPSLGSSADGVLTPLFFVLSRVVGPLTGVFTLLANVWVWRRRRTQGKLIPADRVPSRIWLREYTIWVFAACVIGNALSPSVVMWWHNLIVLHAAVLPIVLWSDALLGTRSAPAVRRVMAPYLALSVVLLLGMAFGSNQYRRGGRDAKAIVLDTDHEIVRDLRLTECCDISVDPETGQWPRKNSPFYMLYVRPFTIPPPDQRKGGEPTN
jgi:hypothetical protein